MTSRWTDQLKSRMGSLVKTAFSDSPGGLPPRYIAHIGCGDGRLLRHLWQLAAAERGEKRAELTLIGIDRDASILETARQQLDDLPCILLHEETGRPSRALAHIRESGVTDLERVLYLSSSLDSHKEDKTATKDPLNHWAEWASVPTDHGHIVAEAHRLEPEVRARYGLEVDPLTSPGQMTASEYLDTAGRVGLFARPNGFKKYPEELPLSRWTVNHFEKRPYIVRPAEERDLPRLYELEEACWIAGLRLPSQVLAQRLEAFPEGNVVLEWNGDVAGVVYWQRIADPALLMNSRDKEVLALHDPRQRVAHLVRLNILPTVQSLGFGDQLLEIMLQRLHMSNDIDSVVAVTLCKDSPADPSMSLQDYIRLQKEPGRLADPILDFHYQHGAEIQGLVPGYRPEDVTNQGHGVLVAYDIHNRLTSGRTDFQPEPPGEASSSELPKLDADEIRERLQLFVRSLLGPQGETSFSPHHGLMEMGLDSLDLTELRARIERYLGVQLSPTFFFNYANVDAISKYLLNTLESRPTNPDKPQRDPPARADRQQNEETAARDAVQPTEESYRDEDVAVIGVSCRFPGGVSTLEEFWNLLESQQDATRRVPSWRWRWPDHVDVESLSHGVKRGGYVRDAASFDAAFFRISPREAEWMDPQQRWLLELSWQALEDAGRDPSTMKRSGTGVFVGVCHYDYRDLLEAKETEGHFSTGNSPSILANRLSYFYDFRGPSVAIDTACSSSLVALHEAVMAVRNGECEEALAGGVNVIASPRYSLSYDRAGMLAADGRCKTFDRSADGYARGEGAALVLLKPMARALADRDRIYAVIKGTAVNHGGAATSLTAPNPGAQAELVATACRRAGVAPEHLGYIEAHGTGTPLGDPIEIEGLQRGFALARQGSATESPTGHCAVGSVKTNIGHLESAAGIAGMVKVLLMLRKRRIPGIVHFEGLNPEIDLTDSPFYIATNTRDWPRQRDEKGGARPLRAGISSFGFGGANAHVVLEEPPAVAASDDRKASEQPPALLTLSGRDEASLRRTVQRYRKYLEQSRDTTWQDICFTARTGRHHFDHRLAVVASSVAESGEMLGHFLEGRHAPGVIAGRSRQPAPGVAFLLTGQGAQHDGMGQRLYDTHPVFKDSLDRCAEGLKSELDRPLLSLLWGDNSHLLNETQYTQPALFALEVSLAAVWRNCGIEPAVVIGHSVGEYAAACLAGVFDLEDGLKLIAARGRLMAELCQPGAMASVLASVDEVAPLLKGLPGLSIAADNGPRQVVVSGDAESMQAFEEKSGQEGLRTRRLDVSHAFHSALMEPMIRGFRDVASSVIYREPKIPLISNVTGELMQEVDAEYWVKHVRGTVHFRAGLEFLSQRGCEIFVEVGPKPVLIGLAKRSLDAVADAAFVPTLVPGADDRQTFLSAVGECYARGLTIDWDGLASRGRRVALPTYPFAKERYWPSLDHTASGRSAADRTHESFTLRGKRLALAGRAGVAPEVYFDKLLGAERLSYLADHRLDGEVVMPGAGYVELALLAMRDLSPSGTLELRDLAFHRPLLLRNGALIQTQVKVRATGREVEIWADTTPYQGNSDEPFSGESFHLLASGQASSRPTHDANEKPTTLSAADAQSLEPTELYAWFRNIGYEYGTEFQAIENLLVGDGVAVSEASLRSSPGDATLPPVLLDAAFQTALALLRDELTDSPFIFIPSGVRWLSLDDPSAPLEQVMITVRRLDSNSESDDPRVHFDVFLTTASGEPVATLHELQLAPFDLQSLASLRADLSAQSYRSFFYRPRWIRSLESRTTSTTDAATRKALILYPSAAQKIASRLVEHCADNAVEVRFDAESRQESALSWQARPGDSALIDAVISAHPEIRRVYFLGGFFTPEQDIVNDAAAFEQSQEQGLMSLFHLVKSLERHGHCDRGLEIKVITHRTHQISPRDTTIPWGGGLTGLANVLAREFSGVDTVHLDVATSTTADVHDIAQAILEEPAQPEGASVALRDGERYRLVNEPVLLPRNENGISFRPRGTYLVLGGAGGIGLVLSRYLAETYQAKLCLVGRSALSDEARRQLEELERFGAEVTYHQADGGDLEAMGEVVARAEQQLGELNGVVHSALQLKDRILANMSEEDFRAALAPKVQASWVLHQATRHRSLDFMLFFSTCLTFYSNRGQSNYIAGSTFKDAFAHYLSSNLGVPTRIVNWGYWSDVGAVSSEAFSRYLAAEGFQGITSAEGIEAIERILSSPATQIMAVKAAEPTLERMRVTTRDHRQFVAEESTFHLEALARASPALPTIPWRSLRNSYAELNRWSTRMALLAFRELGATPGTEASRDSLRDELQVVKDYDSLFAASLDALSSAGFVSIDGETIRFSREKGADLDELENEKRRLREQAPELAGAIDLAWECGRQLVDVLRGQTPATQVIFPDSSMDLVEGFYRRDALADHSNQLVAEACRGLATSASSGGGDRKFKILEFGSGTGGTTQQVLKALEPLAGRLEYVYTDLSIAFLEHGRREFGDHYPFVSYQILDIEKSPNDQGFETGTYDLVIGTNVIHATRDISRSLLNLKSLLKRGGGLLLNELSERQSFLTFTFGLLSGWWLTEDSPRRLPHGPLLSIDLWRKALEDEGFRNVTILDAPARAEEAVKPQNVIVARSDGYIVPGSHSPTSAGPLEVSPAQAQETELEPFEQKSPEELLAGSQEAAISYLESYLRTIVSKTLRLPSERLERPGQHFRDAVLGELGFDSLLYVELRNQLRQDLAIDIAVETFIGANVQKIVGAIYDQLLLQSLNMSLDSSQDLEEVGDEDMEAFVL